MILYETLETFVDGINLTGMETVCTMHFRIYKFASTLNAPFPLMRVSGGNACETHAKHNKTTQPASSDKDLP